MNCTIMRDLLQGLPCKGTTLYKGRTDMGNLSSSRQDEVDVWMQAYADPAFLWRYCRHIVANRLPFPDIPLDGATAFLFRAWLYETRKSAVDHTVASSIGLFSSNLPQARSRRDMLRACVMASDGHDLPDVCARAHVDIEVVEAYEALFYNVSMRVDDALHRLGMAYPDGKAVEYYDGYAKEAAFGDILVRAGYTNGINDVLVMSGLREGSRKIWSGMVGSKELPAQFEAMTITNAYVLARNGYGHQSHLNAPSVSAGRSMINAAKQGGIDSANKVVDAFDPVKSLFAAFSSQANAFGEKQAMLRQKLITEKNLREGKTLALAGE